MNVVHIDAMQVRAIVGAVALVLCLVLAAWWVVDVVRQRLNAPGLKRWARVVGAGSAVAVVAGAPMMPTPVVTVPVSDVVAPAVAVSVLRRILAVRRRQLRDARTGALPRTLGEDEQVVLAEVLRQASRHVSGTCDADVDMDVVPPRVAGLLMAVEEVCNDGMLEESSVDAEWILMVRLIGEPVLENRNGDRAHFGKRRSMELLAWMALNRDRSTRSAARTAIWDVDVAGSTFSTVVSDMRRSMRTVSASAIEVDWSPATHSESLPLSPRVVTDVELIQGALARDELPGLVAALLLVRDMPFAGTSYAWADLDGSTTRIVMTVMKAVWRVIDLSAETNDKESAIAAISAGLRVMPGDQELLACQRDVLSTCRP